MKYISGIVDSSGKELETFSFTMWDGIDEFRFLVYDTDDDSVSSYSCLEHLDCYGLSPTIHDSEGHAVKHNQKTVSLYRYVEYAKTILGTREVPQDGVDKCAISNGFFDKSGVVGNSQLVVNIVNDSVTFLGESGSVAVRQTGFIGDVKLYTLYDLLGLLCRECHLNLMLYTRIYLFSKRNNFTSILGLRQDAEAKRYFLKMYMDVVKT